jgi:hypothetical protein
MLLNVEDRDALAPLRSAGVAADIVGLKVDVPIAQALKARRAVPPRRDNY